MKLHQLIMLLGLVLKVNGDNCNGIVFRDEYFNIKVLREGITELRGLTALRSRGENFKDKRIYFTYTYVDKKIYSKSAYLTIDDRKYHIFNSINNTNTNFADNASGKIYIGAENGIYIANNDENVTKTNITTDNVISIYANDTDVYFVNNKSELFINKYGLTTKVAGLDKVKIKQLVVNSKGKIIFTNNLDEVGVASLNVDGSIYSVATGMRSRKAKTLSVDNKGIAYICSTDGIYEYNQKRDDFTKVSNLDHLQGIVFGFDNSPVYAVNGYLVQLIRSEVPCFGD